MISVLRALEKLFSDIGDRAAQLGGTFAGVGPFQSSIIERFGQHAFRLLHLKNN